jgi:gliding motility-associated-like protein
MLWGITPLDVPGSYTFNNLTLKGCDSLLHINLSQLDHYENTIDSSACSETLPWDDTLLTAPGYYTFNYTASNGCDSLLHLNIILLDNPLTLIDTGACDEQFPWQDSLYDVPGEYDIIYAAANGCDSTLHLVLEQYPSHHRYETILLEEDEEHVGPDGQTYHPGDIYDIMLQTKHGCDSIIHVSLINSGCTPKIWAPNAFTPLQSSNNQFRVASSNVTEMTVSIYQRWGDWVCTFDGLTEGWNGTLRGQPCQEGAYVYLIRYKTTCTPKPKTLAGTVTIIH